MFNEKHTHTNSSMSLRNNGILLDTTGKLLTCLCTHAPKEKASFISNSIVDKASFETKLIVLKAKNKG